MTQGIALMAFGDATYGKYAFNLALSLKRFSPALKIQLIHDDIALSQLDQFHLNFFDHFTPLKKEDMYVNDKLYPAQVKTRIYDYLVFNESIYLDVDAVALKDITPLMNLCSLKEGYYFTQVHRLHRLEDGRGEIRDMAWATADTIWNHYRLKEDAILPATQSSFAYIKKCNESESLFKKLQENLSNPIPLEKLRYKWGGSQPDELYLNVTLAQLGLNPSLGIDPIYFSNYQIKNQSIVEQDYYLLGVFGGTGVTHSSVHHLYDRIMQNYCREHFNLPHQFKNINLVKYKFSGKR
jgi:hypothetical protein